MNLQTIKEAIVKEENAFPKLFASYEERDYGILFHDTDNPESNDSNHAILFPDRVGDLRRVLNEIIAFYDGIGLLDRFSIYHPFAEDYFVDNARALMDCGLQFTVCPDNRYMLLREECTIGLPRRLDIGRVTAWDGDVERGVLACVAEKAHFMKVIKHGIDNPDNYLFMGYTEGEAVSLLAFHVSEHGVTRFDEMGTADRHRHKGYAREMNRFAVRYVKNHNMPIAYQWPAHRTSERITAEAGFRLALTLSSGYAVMAEYR